MEEIINSLNPSQREAVLHCDGPSLVIAGAGSGKTRVLTTKIAYLLSKGLYPSTILALTFTNKAAKEMKERIGRMVGQTTASRLWMGTFHSIFSRILRAEAEHIGFTSDFTIYDSQDTKNLLKTIIKEMKLDDKVYKPNAVYSRISSAKNALYTPGMYAASQQLMEQDFNSKMPEIRNIYQTYARRCKDAGAMDFDDLLLYTNILFHKHPEVLEKYKNRFMYILVDEYQDTNYAQHLIVQQLAGDHHRVCVVGDDAQSIYSFRGANIDNILNFKSTFPECKVFKLEQNYRSTQTIVDAANSLIKKNRQQIQKNVFSENEVGEQIGLFSAYSDYEEGYLVANKIAEKRLTEHADYKDFVILYRTNAQSRIMEEALRKRNIPYRIYGGLSFYQRKEIKDVLAYCRLIINPKDEESFKRVINYPARGIGDTTVGKIADAALLHNASLWDVLNAPLDYALKINAGTAKKLAVFRELIDNFRELASELSAHELVLAVVKMTGIASDLTAEGTIEGLTKTQNVEELLKGVQEYCMMKQEEGIESPSLSDFLSEVSLATDQDTDKEEDKNKVTMMTIHSAKGLEFKHVFVVGLEEDLFPSSLAKMSARELEEERRLFYVAITRAEKSCILTYAKSRFKHGQSQMSAPSRFLKDIDPQYLADQSIGATGNTLFTTSPQQVNTEQQRKASAYDQLSASVSAGAERFRQKLKPLSEAKPKATTVNNNVPSAGITADGLQSGVTVQHDRFGQGVVTRIEGEGDNLKAIIQFETFGEKTLLLRFAKLTIV